MALVLSTAWPRVAGFVAVITRPGPPRRMCSGPWWVASSTEDFEVLAEQVIGEQLDGFFDAWIHSTGRPARTVDNGLA